ncbi:phosphatidate phosphatase PAH1-like [Cucurbita moschata]|uniref:phosphatidate phosphatase n=1 Tax=Cucurbita moschata TaxID=3662 RepID=A0A6J1FB10_CUCMO|nr:phosphatidate phosphatase PAH1-like [Cucurbita moschata]XP_022935616.1 phosphatidate phosphatase PAH1-like [Cucurbita moschata]XP_022935617.1 phosphatidate phosphatase PAH1-like [Cucurbita moschata]XP_022935618.1 phosphatidate phosphatase PAH1-like [Cucurbita moschata]XP_022935619.1 phosphatidate phosphatase PAH1-like [Cucurbita moschata]XP_022935620.1 phosphatidate phosphatase PAH1-like [Cucurbita moschata]
MNVVGRVGSLISQGVYSVATPFHPFGGAVDIIVVQQQDGSFRSAPWYVRFGKFQGVLKGTEKIVHISVNGIEANFHMYLDNSGEAYFIKEVETGQGDQADGVTDDMVKDGVIFVDSKDDHNKNFIVTGRLEHSVSDTTVIQLRDEDSSMAVARLERAESDVEHRFYDFQDELSSVEDLESNSNRYENLETESCAESQGTDSEVILVSVDGQVLTAPILATEQNTEDVQLSTPQFHLGPGEGTEFCEDDEFTGEDAWAADYINQLNTSTENATMDKVGGLSNESKGSAVSQTEETRGTRDGRIRIEKAISKDCLELSKFAKLVGNTDSESVSSPVEAEYLEEKVNTIVPSVSKTNGGSVVDSRDRNGTRSGSDSDSSVVNMTREVLVKAGGTEENVFDDKQFDNTIEGIERMDSGSQGPVADDECSVRELEIFPADALCGSTYHHSTSFEISLCGHELRAGMGLVAAAEVFDAHRVSAEEFEKSASSITKNGNLIIRYGERYMSWEKAAPIILGMAAFGVDLEVDPKDAISVEQDGSLKPGDDESTPASTPAGRRWRLWHIPFRRIKTLDHSNSSSSNEEIFVDSECTLQNSLGEQSPRVPNRSNEPSKRQLVRTNVPTTEQIASLNLKEGQNMIAFTFSTRVLGTQKVDAHIYLWKWNARIVISDVDGTITKSDVLGQFMPLVGKDWTQSGVARLFTAIKENGYQLLFLSARAIVQAYLTRSFLLNLKQDGKALPNGPIVISPDGLFPSLFREVIRRAPHEFKIACLEDIKKLFPPDYNPFYAGFGNRDTDELSYRKVGIPKGKIFIINPKGEVAISHRIDVKSYTSLHTLVNDMFPPTSLVEQEDYNAWNFWKVPLPEIDL